MPCFTALLGPRTRVDAASHNAVLSAYDRACAAEAQGRRPKMKERKRKQNKHTNLAITFRLFAVDHIALHHIASKRSGQATGQVSPGVGKRKP